MKTFLLLVLLGLILYLGYRRAQNYGWPWQEQVVITRAEHSTRGRDTRSVFVDGELMNRTAAPGTAVVECKVLPGGITLSPKAVATVELPPRSSVGFRTSTSTPTRATGVACKVTKWDTASGLEVRLFDRARTFVQRFL